MKNILFFIINISIKWVFKIIFNIESNRCNCSDPKTYLMYIVREHFYEYLKISPFEDNTK